MSKSKIHSLVLMGLSLACILGSMFANEHTEVVLLVLAVIFYLYHISLRIDDIEEYHHDAMSILMEQSENWGKYLKEMNEKIQEEQNKRKEKEEEKQKQ